MRARLRTDRLAPFGAGAKDRAPRASLGAAAGFNARAAQPVRGKSGNAEGHKKMRAPSASVRRLPGRRSPFSGCGR